MSKKNQSCNGDDYEGEFLKEFDEVRERKKSKSELRVIGRKTEKPKLKNKELVLA